MRAYAPALRMCWAVFGMAAAVVLALGTAADILIFMLAFGSHAGSYAGQAHDRHLAWLLLYSLAAGWVFVLVAVLWPAIRWKRRGMLTAVAEEPGSMDGEAPGRASEPAR